MWTLPIVEVHPFSDARLGLRASFPGVQVDALVFREAPEPLDEDVVEKAAFSIHRDADGGSAQTVCPGKRGELRSLIGIHDLRRAEPGDRLIQCLDTEVRLQSVR